MHTPKMNGVIERIFAVIKEGVLSMLLNAKINETAQKMLCTEAVHTCKRIRKSMATTGSTKIPSINVYGEKTRSLVRYWS